MVANSETFLTMKPPDQTFKLTVYKRSKKFQLWTCKGTCPENTTRHNFFFCRKFATLVSLKVPSGCPSSHFFFFCTLIRACRSKNHHPFLWAFCTFHTSHCFCPVWFFKRPETPPNIGRYKNCCLVATRKQFRTSFFFLFLFKQKLISVHPDQYCYMTGGGAHHR